MMDSSTNDRIASDVVWAVNPRLSIWTYGAGFCCSNVHGQRIRSQKYKVSVMAYSIAGGIGIMRVMNNRHWISDVLAGVGVGLLSTNIAYLTHQYRWGKRKNPLHY